MPGQACLLELRSALPEVLVDHPTKLPPHPLIDSSSVSSVSDSPLVDRDRQPLSWSPPSQVPRSPWALPPSPSVAPTRYRLWARRPSLCDTEKIFFIVLAYSLNLISTRHDASLPFAGCKSSPFHAGDRVPVISLSAYLTRIIDHAMCPNHVYVFAAALIFRAGKRNPALLASSWNIHRLLIVAVMVAAKVQEDKHYNNRFYGVLGGLQLSEINALEVTFLETLEFNALVTMDELAQTEARLVEEILESSHPTSVVLCELLSAAGFVFAESPNMWAM